MSGRDSFPDDISETVSRIVLILHTHTYLRRGGGGGEMCLLKVMTFDQFFTDNFEAS